MQLKKDTYSEEAPPFGHELLKHFAIDPDYTNLNHGSYVLYGSPLCAMLICG